MSHPPIDPPANNTSANDTSADNTSRRALHRALAAVLTLGLLGAGLTGPAAAARDVPGLAASASVRTSGTAAGSSARSIVDTGSADRLGASWRSPTAAGAYVRLIWPRRVTVRSVTLVQDPAARSKIDSGTLTFSDGSAVQTRLRPDGATVVPLRGRSVASLRFTVTTVAAGADTAALAEILVGSSSRDGVVTDSVTGGDVATTATVTASEPAGAAALIDGGATQSGSSWLTGQPADAWVRLGWSRPREIGAVQLVGSPGSGTTVARGRLVFSDGSTLAVGAVVPDPRQPTTIAFQPRVTTTVRFEVLAVAGQGPLSLAELRVFQRGSTPTRAVAPGVTPSSRRAPQSCAANGAGAGLAVLCPLAGTRVGRQTDVVVSAPGATSVSATVWPSDARQSPGQAVASAPTGQGRARLALDLGALPDGPFTVVVTASSAGQSDRTAYLQLFKGDRVDRRVTTDGPTAGRTLAYSEDFTSPLSVSRSGLGADYAAAKPNRGGAEDFGQAIFADPSAGFDNLEVTGGQYLRLVAQPRPADYPDPNSWNRDFVGAMLSSARGGGSGFSAQYGYFEARVLAPAAPGTWPAFWMLPNPVLSQELTATTEIDAAELYGQFPESSCATTHRYVGGTDNGEIQCARRYASTRAAMAWHTYGVKVTSTAISYYVDGQAIVTHRQQPAGDQPMFFMINLALGGGWPIDLSGTQGRVAMYVDYVRVYV